MTRLEHIIRMARLIGRHLWQKTDEPELEAWLQESQANHTLFHKLRDGKEWADKLAFYESLDTEAEWQRLKRRLKGVHPARRRTLSFRHVASVAAALCALLAVTWAVLPSENGTPAPVLFDGSRTIPGREMATLTGGTTTYALNEHTRVDASDTGMTLTDSTGTRHLARQATATPYVLRVPRGGEYALTLPDGTRVWMNADSELRFPSRFEGNERRISLRGEAYLEVAKDAARPFYVETGQNVVHVTGTAFNIRCYDDEGNMIVTLAQGRVDMEKTDGTLLASLHPAQQFVSRKSDGSYRVEAADLDKALAWHRGVFMFRDEPLPAIARELSRWYDVPIHVSPSLQDKRYSGELNRYDTIDPLLSILRGTGELEFIEGDAGVVQIVPVADIAQP